MSNQQQIDDDLFVRTSVFLVLSDLKFISEEAATNYMCSIFPGYGRDKITSLVKEYFESKGVEVDESEDV